MLMSNDCVKTQKKKTFMTVIHVAYMLNFQNWEIEKSLKNNNNLFSFNRLKKNHNSLTINNSEQLDKEKKKIKHELTNKQQRGNQTR